MLLGQKCKILGQAGMVGVGVGGISREGCKEAYAG